MGYRIVRKPSKSYIVRSGANYYAEDDITLQNSLGTTTQDFYGALVNTVYGLIYIGNDTYLVATADLEMVGDVSDYNQIQSMDDITPIRYGYGNQNGYVIGIGTELNGTYENGVFTVGSGLAVVQGVEIDIDTNGITATLDTTNETRYYKIYLKVNFNRAINLYDANLVSYYSTVSYDEIQDPTSGELRNNQTAYLELYRIKLNGATEAEKSKTVDEVKYNITDAETINGLSITQDDNNVLHVGNEVVSKKKLLWSGLVYINEDRYITVVENMPNPSNKTIEIVMGQRVNDYWWSREKIRWTFGFNNVRHDIFAMIKAPEYSNADGSLHWIVLDGRWENNILSMTAQRYTFNANTGTKTATNRCVSEIYEIIE